MKVSYTNEHGIVTYSDGTGFDIEGIEVIASRSISVDFYISSAGSDTTGTGSRSNPYKSLARAELEKWKHSNVGLCVMRLVDAGPFEVATHRYMGELLVIIGHDGTKLLDTDITGIMTAAANSADLYLKLTDGNAFDVDTNIGATLRVLTGTKAGFRRMIRGHQPKVAVDLIATTNVTLSGAQTVDGVATNGKRVLCVAQTDTTKSTCYLANDAGTWHVDKGFDSSYEVEDVKVSVALGNTHAGEVWFQRAHLPTCNAVPMIGYFLATEVTFTVALDWSKAETVISSCGDLAGVLANDTVRVSTPTAVLMCAANDQGNGTRPDLQFVGYPDVSQGRSSAVGGLILCNVYVDTPGAYGSLNFSGSTVRMYGVRCNPTKVFFDGDGARLISGLYDAGAYYKNTTAWRTLLDLAPHTSDINDAASWQGWGLDLRRDQALFNTTNGWKAVGYWVLGFTWNANEDPADFQMYGGRLCRGIWFASGNGSGLNGLICAAADIQPTLLVYIGACLRLGHIAPVIFASNVTGKDWVWMLGSGHAELQSTNGHCVGGYGIRLDFGGSVGFHDNVSHLTGDAGDLHFAKGDYSISYLLNSPYPIITDNVPPYATGGRAQVNETTGHAIAPGPGPRVRQVDGTNIAVRWTDELLIVDNSSAPASIQLPDPAFRVRPFRIQLKADPGVHAVTLIRHGSEQIAFVANTYSLVSQNIIVDCDEIDYYVM
jgi:hypothetical protein